MAANPAFVPPTKSIRLYPSPPPGTIEIAVRSPQMRSHKEALDAGNLIIGSMDLPPLRSVAQPGKRASALGAEGRRFESCHSDQPDPVQDAMEEIFRKREAKRDFSPAEKEKPLSQKRVFDIPIRRP
jgi:hypothetical protein